LPLQAIASAGAAVLLLRHPRKSDGTQATAGRGSGAIAGFADIIVEMRRYVPDDLQDTRRVLTVYSRYEPFEVVIRWHGDGQYETLGSPTAYAAEAQRERLLEALAEGSATTGELAKAVELPHATVSRRLSELEAAGLVVRTGTGKRGDPYRWSLANGGDDPDGDNFFSPTKAPIVGETKTDGNPENPHQNCEIGGHDPAGVTGETELSHEDAKIGGQTPVREAGETELPHQDAKIGGHGCAVCGKPVAHWGGKPARFCSDNCRKKFTRQQGAPGRATPAVEKAESGPPDPSVCLDCHQPITAEGFQYICPPCMKLRYDKLQRQYPEKLIRWLEQQHGR
jgi:hypothetical protein